MRRRGGGSEGYIPFLAVTQEQSEYCKKLCVWKDVSVCVCGSGGGSGLMELHCQKHLAKFVFYGRPVFCS